MRNFWSLQTGFDERKSVVVGAMKRQIDNACRWIWNGSYGELLMDNDAKLG